jgi:Phosphate-selective porin O and P
MRRSGAVGQRGSGMGRDGMRWWPCWSCVPFLLLVVMVPWRGAIAQTPDVRLHGVVQAQYRLSTGQASAAFNPDAVSSAFELRRLRLGADARIGQRIQAVAQTDLTMSTLRMLNAFVRLAVTSHVAVSVGQEKSPFQRYELTSASALPSIERGVRIRGLQEREGLNDLLVANGYAKWDLGAFLDVTVGGGSARVGVQNGSRESVADVNEAKSFFGRATMVMIRASDGKPQLEMGASVASRDRAVCSVCTGTVAFVADSALRTMAFGADAEWGGGRPGLHVIADVATGDNVPYASRVNVGRNTGNVTSTAAPVVTFRGASVVSAWRFATRGSETRLVQALEPALRVDWLDPDTGTSDDAGLLITPAVSLYFTSNMDMRVGLDWYRYREGGLARHAAEFKVEWEASF